MFASSLYFNKKYYERKNDERFLYKCIDNTFDHPSIEKIIILYIQCFPKELNKRDEDGSTIIMHAVRRIRTSTSLSIIKKLISHGADLSVCDNKGETVLTQLLYAKPSEDKIKLLKILLNYIDTKTYDQKTMKRLYRAIIASDNYLILKILLDHGLKRRILVYLLIYYSNDETYNQKNIKLIMSKFKNLHFKINGIPAEKFFNRE